MNQLFGLQHRNRVGWLSPPGRRAKPSSTSEVWRCNPLCTLSCPEKR